MPEHEQVEMGHWATGSGMPRRYDSAACVTELVAKSVVTNALRSGWSVAEPGCVPLPPPPAPTDSFIPAPPKPKKPRCTAAAVARVDASITHAVRPVVHFQSGKMHLWHSGARSICSKWNCGQPDSRASTAVFGSPPDIANGSEANQCKSCFGARLSFLRLEKADHASRASRSTAAESDSSDSSRSSLYAGS